MIVESKNLKQVASQIVPDVIYNRFDLTYSKEDCFAVCLKEKDMERVVPVCIQSDTAILGLWLGELTPDQMAHVTEHIFHSYTGVKRVRYENSYCNYGSAITKNHFRIELPDNAEQLRSRLSSKGRYNIQREKKILEQDFGQWHVEEYIAEDAPEELFKTYFQMKKATHGINYKMTKEEYIKKFFVSHVYVLQTEQGTAAIVLSCEQCPIVYLENLTYDLEMAKYSPGQILYDLFLERIIEKGKKDIYLAGGKLSYKKRYGSIEETVYNGVVYRNILIQGKEQSAIWLRKKAKQAFERCPAFVKSWYRKMRGSEQ